MFNMSMLKPASYFARNYGVKSIAYGPPGSAKTPIIATAPRPVLLACEPGLLSMRNVNNVATYVAETGDEMDDFLLWAKTSNEAKNFDTLSIDSISQMCEIYIADQFRANKKAHGLKVYGNMATKVMQHLYDLYYMREKHVHLIAKMQVFEVDGQPVTKRPYFPGKEVPVRAPHLFDEILYQGIAMIPGVGETLAFRTKSNFEILARDRSGALNEYEPCDLTALFNKCLAGPQPAQ